MNELSPLPVVVSPPIADRAEPVTIREVLREFREEFLEWDSGVLGTFVDMTMRPSRVVHAYIWERERRYVRPLRYLLFSIAVNIGAAWLVLDKLGMRGHLGTGAKTAQQSSFLLEHAVLLTLLVVPLVAAVMRLTFHGLRIRFVDALVLMAYTQAQVNLFGLLSLAWLAAVGNNRLEMPTSLLSVGYLIWAWASFAQGPAWRRGLSAAVTLVLGQLVNGLVVYGALAVS